MVPISAPGMRSSRYCSRIIPFGSASFNLPFVRFELVVALASEARERRAQVPGSAVRKDQLIKPQAKLGAALDVSGANNLRHRATNGTALGNDDVIPHGDGINGFAIDSLADECRFGVNGIL